MKARVIADAAIFAAFIIFGLVGLWFSKFPVDKTVWWIGFIVFAGWLIVEICFISPYNHAKALVVKIDALEERLKPRITVSYQKMTNSADYLQDLPANLCFVLILILKESN